MARALPQAVAARAPFYYGWVVLGCLCCAGFARQSSSVATLSIFIEPLTREFGWSRTAISGAVSLGGVLAALVSPMIGPLVDRRGSRLVLGAAILTNAVALVLLSQTPSLLIFYLLFCIARMNWAGPFDLGIYTALNNWFMARRTAAASIANLGQMIGLVAMPLIAQAAISYDGWRTAWIVLAVMTVLIGFVPVWLFVVRRPEDMGLPPDPMPAAAERPGAAAAIPEPKFSRREALRTPAFWLLMLYTAMVYPVQAGVSLHQAPHLIERGIDPVTAAMTVGGFSLMSGLATIVCGFLPRRLPVRFPLAAAGAVLAIGVSLMPGITTAAEGFLAAGLYGIGIGAVLTLTPVAWADYFGRANYGAIRGIALSTQVLSQAAGPLLSGVLYDLSGSYTISLVCFATLSLASALVALVARQPRYAG